MVREACLVFLGLAFLASVTCLPARNILTERRLRRQASRIPYASLSTGAISARLRNRIRGRRPSTSSRSSGSEGRSSTSSGGVGSSRGSASTGSSPRRYGSSGGYHQGGQGGSSDDGVPIGHSTYPYGVSRYTNSQSLQTPYGDQPAPGTGASYGRQTMSGYQTRYPQPPNQFQPYAGYGSSVGYGMVPSYGTYGPNPYNYMVGGGVPQVPYVNSNPWGQGGGYYGGTYGGEQYRDVSGRTAIGSPYRDPNSRFTSWVHPQGEVSNPYSGSSYGRGGSGRGSYYGSSSYGGSADPYGSGISDGSYSPSNPYASPGSSGGGYTGTNSYGSSSSSQSQYSQPGGSTPSYGDGTSLYQNGDDYGGTSRSFGSPYGGSEIYDGSYGGVEDQYSQTSGSRYGSTSGSRYDDYAHLGSGRQSSPLGTSQQSTTQLGTDRRLGQNNLGGQGSLSQNNGRQPGRYHIGEYSRPSDSESYSSSRYHGRLGSGDLSSTQGGSGQPSGTLGRFFNPDASRGQSTNGSPAYHSGRFYDANEDATGTSHVTNTRGPGYSSISNQALVPRPSSNVNGESTSAARTESVETLPRENYNSQHGTFLVERRPDILAPERRNKTNALHPSQQKCERADDGLPDLFLDYERMRPSVHLARIPISNLTCAMSKEADCLSASAYGANRITLRRLLRFNTVAHNIGTADFLPNLEPDEWILHSCHKHWHSMKEFAHFHLFDVNGTLVGQGHKVSFCLEDSECNNPCKKSYECTRNTQAISPGCRDVYEASYDCQWVDVTDVPPGQYKLRVTVNPVVDGIRVPELFYGNNVVECTVEIMVTEAEAIACKAV